MLALNTSEQYLQHYLKRWGSVVKFYDENLDRLVISQGERGAGTLLPWEANIHGRLSH